MSFDAIPVWVLFVATIVLVMASLALGHRIGRAVRRHTDEEKEAPASAIASAVLGLSAFMLAFTFGIVSDRYDARKALVREDANAIRAAWQRSDFLPEPDRAEAVTLLRQYVDMRVKLAQAGDSEPQRVNEALAEMTRVQEHLWAKAVAHARKDMDSDVGTLYLVSLNQVNSLHALRVALGIQARIPTDLWLVLYIITMLGMIGVGYQTGIAGSRPSKARTLLALAFALVIALIASLDRPHSGIMRVTQQPLIDLRATMDASPDRPLHPK